MLTDTHCRNAKPKPKLYRLTDHRGLCLEVKPSGVKAWRYRFTLEGKASMFALGEYPAISLAEARDRCEAARQLVKQGINPAQQRQIDRIKQASDAEITFEKVAREWLQTKDWEGFMPTLNRIADVVNRYGKTSLTIVGHTDSVGSDASNMDLSNRRAQAVEQYLEGQRVHPERLTAYGKGESEPRTSNDSEQGRALNRRVEVLIVPVVQG